MSNSNKELWYWGIGAGAVALLSYFNHRGQRQTAGQLLGSVARDTMQSMAGEAVNHLNHPALRIAAEQAAKAKFLQQHMLYRQTPPPRTNQIPQQGRTIKDAEFTILEDDKEEK